MGGGRAKQDSSDPRVALNGKSPSRGLVGESNDAWKTDDVYSLVRMAINDPTTEAWKAMEAEGLVDKVSVWRDSDGIPRFNIFAKARDAHEET